MDPAERPVREELVNGRYRVLRALGEGAMGSVYLVADTLDDDRQVALKKVRRGLLSSQSFRLFRDEFSAMAQLRHPNVVEVYDFGAIGGTGDHFFTMEFVDGKNLFEACQDTLPARIHGYAVQICRALEYIHSQGFVHFDLKPDNIMVDAGGVVKVMDFGLVEKGSFVQAQVLKGTVAYIAPEMIKGEKVNHRLDLYSLGAVLFHVLTGRILFSGKTLVEILQRHVNEAPNLTDGLPRPIPPELAPILTRLLAKSPLERYASAADVLVDLEREQGQGDADKAKDSLAVYKLGSRLVGREQQLGRLLEIFRQQVIDYAPEGPRAVLVLGGSGTGKSRLMQELRHEVQIEGVGFVHGACIQNGGHSYLPFAEILRTLVRQILASGPDPGAETATAPTAPMAPIRAEAPPQSPSLFDVARSFDATMLAARAADPQAREEPTREEPTYDGPARDAQPLDAARTQPVHTFSSLSPALGSDPNAATITVQRASVIDDPRPSQPVSGERPLPLTSVSDHRSRRLIEARAVALSVLIPEEAELRALAEGRHEARRPGREKDWLIDAICDFFVELSRVHPVILYCSDLQWADDLTIELFARLARAACEARRADGPSAESPARLLLCGCARDDEIAGGTLEKALEELAAASVGEAIRVGPLDPSAVAEMLRSMLGQVEVPDDALDLLIARTGGIPFSIEATVQNLLENRAATRRGSSLQIDAGALGSAFASATVAEALDRTLDKLSAGEASLVRLLAVFNRPAPLALLREAGAPAGDELAQTLTRLRGRHLVQRGWAEGNYQWALRHAKLRDHVYAGIEPDERSRLHAAAGAALDRAYPGADRYLEDISQHFERADRIDEAVHYLRAAGAQARRVYDLKRAAALYVRACDALATLPETPERRLLSADLAVALAEVSYYSPSERNAERLKHALQIVDALADDERRARVYNWLGRTNYALGRNGEAIRCFQEFMRLTEGTADNLTRALPYEVLGRVYIFMGRFEQARDYLGRATALLRDRPGCEEDLSYVLGMYGGAFLYLGEFDRAEELTLESIALADRIGHRMRVTQGRIYLGIAYCIRGEWARARAVFEESLEDARRDANIIGTGAGSSFLGLTHLASGDARRAVELSRFGRDHIAAAGGTWTFSMIGWHLAEALLASGEPESALQVARETLPIIAAGERWGETGLLTAMGRIHARLGDGAAARQSFADALRAAEEQGSPTFLAKVNLATGAFLLSEGEAAGAVDALEGRALIERALASFEAFGMPWYAARARALLGGNLDNGPCP